MLVIFRNSTDRWPPTALRGTLKSYLIGNFDALSDMRCAVDATLNRLENLSGPSSISPQSQIKLRPVLGYDRGEYLLLNQLHHRFSVRIGATGTSVKHGCFILARIAPTGLVLNDYYGPIRKRNALCSYGRVCAAVGMSRYSIIDDKAPFDKAAQSDVRAFTALTKF